MATKKDVLASVIIPAHNEQNYIEKTLKWLKKQSYKNIEIIVVDDGSRDKTAAIAKRHTDIVLMLKKRKGVSYARNRGARIAKGNILIFLDADTIMHDRNALCSIIRYVKAGYSHGTCNLKPESAKYLPYCLIKNFFTKNTPFKASNGVLFIRRDIHHKIGGFNENKDKEEIFEYFKKAEKHGRFKLVDAEVVTSMRRGGTKTLLYWIGIRTGLLRKKPYPVIR